jgi:hypothetical protein
MRIFPPAGAADSNHHFNCGGYVTIVPGLLFPFKGAVRVEACANRLTLSVTIELSYPPEYRFGYFTRTGTGTIFDGVGNILLYFGSIIV